MKGFVDCFQRKFVKEHFVGVMNTFKKMLRARVHLACLLPHQEEDSEEEPKLKYERLSNGVTEILQKDAASCMTVHDKVKVIIHQPQGHSNLKSTRLKYRFHIVYVDIQEMSSSKLLFFFYPLCAVSEGGPFFSHLSLLCLSGRHIKRNLTPLSSSFYSHSYIFLRSSPLFV